MKARVPSPFSAVDYNDETWSRLLETLGWREVHGAGFPVYLNRSFLFPAAGQYEGVCLLVDGRPVLNRRLTLERINERRRRDAARLRKEQHRAKKVAARPRWLP